MTRLSQLHQLIEGTVHRGATPTEDHDHLPMHAMALTLHEREDGHDAELLLKMYGEVLSPSDIAAMHTTWPGAFITIFGAEVHHLRVQLTDLDYPSFVQPDTAAKETP